MLCWGHAARHGGEQRPASLHSLWHISLKSIVSEHGHAERYVEEGAHVEGGVLRACSQRGSVGRQALLAHEVSNYCYGGLALIACRCSQQHTAPLLNAPACQQTGIALLSSTSAIFWLPSFAEKPRRRFAGQQLKFRLFRTKRVYQADKPHITSVHLP